MEVKTGFFANRDKCKPVLLRHSLAGNLETTYVPIWDRIEGAWLFEFGHRVYTEEKNMGVWYHSEIYMGHN
jgi:hypothetical protein